jgi:hypothetical protein
MSSLSQVRNLEMAGGQLVDEKSACSLIPISLSLLVDMISVHKPDTHHVLVQTLKTYPYSDT